MFQKLFWERLECLKISISLPFFSLSPKQPLPSERSFLLGRVLRRGRGGGGGLRLRLRWGRCRRRSWAPRRGDHHGAPQLHPPLRLGRLRQEGQGEAVWRVRRRRRCRCRGRGRRDVQAAAAAAAAAVGHERASDDRDPSGQLLHHPRSSCGAPLPGRRRGQGLLQLQRGGHGRGRRRPTPGARPGRPARTEAEGGDAGGVEGRRGGVLRRVLLPLRRLELQGQSQLRERHRQDRM